MSSSRRPGSVTIASGDLLQSSCQTLVNTVNCVGIMGKGIAAQFKRRYPDMFVDYARRCERHEVKLGKPYVFATAGRLIVNFPTKDHWRAVSRLEDIISGLEYLEKHYREWGITSIAVPPLGCGNGQLEWKVVGPTLYRYLSRLDIPVELYAPREEAAGGTEALFDLPSNDATESRHEPFVEAQWVAVVAVLDRLERQKYHWPVGRVLFQKLVYFATQAGVPTDLNYEAGSYGPYAADLKRMVARLQNNGLAVERQSGKMFEMRVGPTYRDAVAHYRDRMEGWRSAVERTVDLMSRMNTTTAEVAASVHFAANDLMRTRGHVPTATEVVEAVEVWKARRQPPLTRESIVQALAVLAMRGWIDVELDEQIEPMVEALVTA